MSEGGASAGDRVASRRPEATRLGERLVDRLHDPEAFVTLLSEGLERLSDGAYRETVGRVSPGVDADLAVRKPLVSAIASPLRKALRETSSSHAISLAQRLGQATEPALRAFALPPLEMALVDDPERAWQQLRRLGHRAEDWTEVDAMAPLWARGVLAEAFRWAELEQLVYAPRTMERRIVGATLASMPHVLPTARRSQLVGDASSRAYELVRLLIGDAEPMVQKSLSWAIREWARLDAIGTADLLRDETKIATERDDGHRAWVVRDALASQPDDVAHELRERLSAIRRRATAPPTSIAAEQARSFGSIVDGSSTAVTTQGDRFTRSHA